MSVTPRRAAVMHAQETNAEEDDYSGKATVHYDGSQVSVVFTDGVSLGAEKLIRDHAFNIAPCSARENYLKVYTRVYDD